MEFKLCSDSETRAIITKLSSHGLTEAQSMLLKKGSKLRRFDDCCKCPHHVSIFKLFPFFWRWPSIEILLTKSELQQCSISFPLENIEYIVPSIILIKISGYKIAQQRNIRKTIHVHFVFLCYWGLSGRYSKGDSNSYMYHNTVKFLY